MKNDSQSVHGSLNAPGCAVVLVAAAPLEERLRLFTPIAAEVVLEEIDHRPEVPALLHVYLEEITEIIHGWARVPEEALLLDARRLGVALGDDEAAKRIPMLARHLLPNRFPEIVAEADGAIFHGIREKNAPAVIRHFDVIEMRPAVRLHTNGRAKIDVVPLEPEGPHLFPPIDEAGLPGSRARCRRLSSERLTLLGIRSLLTTSDIAKFSRERGSRAG